MVMARDWYDYRFPRYPASRPREAKGGIKAQSKRGGFGENWWAKRWIAVLESFNIGARLSRGRSYARGGQVLGIHVEKGQVQAQVQGSRPSPYKIEIETKQLDPADWSKVARALAGQALHAAKLLAGEMPGEIEDVFKACGLSLFPAKLGDLKTGCSCPDWSNPCKHIAAVYYLLGEEFDRDPFLIFKLRGLDRAELMKRLGEAGAKAGASKSRASRSPDTEAQVRPVEPLEADSSRFWGRTDLPQDLLGEIAAPPVTAALPKRLRGFPLWRGERPLLEAIQPIYSAATQKALEVCLGTGAAAKLD
jgi:uncharacterized Zn finger protein